MVQTEAWWRMTLHPADVTKSDVLDLFFERGRNFRYFNDREGSAMPWPEIQELVTERRGISPGEVTVEMVEHSEVEMDKAWLAPEIDVHDPLMQWSHLEESYEGRIVEEDAAIGSIEEGVDAMDWD